MRRILSFLILLAIITGGAFAQELTWINPNNILNSLLPESMRAAVTNGHLYDEVDVIVRAPGELSNYEGYGVFTQYGNFEDWDTIPVSGTAAPTINPFTTGAFTPGTYLLGYTFPFMDSRAGIVGGFEFSKGENLNIAAASTGDDIASWDESITNQQDTDANGTANFTVTETRSFTDYNQGTQTTIGTGADLGFIGASLYASMGTDRRIFGGSASYTFTEGEDTAGNDFVTSQTVYYGAGEEGAARALPTGASEWAIGANAQLPLQIGDLELPVTAMLFLQGDPDETFGVIVDGNTFPAVSYSASVANANGTANASTVSYTAGETAVAATWDPDAAVNGIDQGGATWTPAAIRTALNGIFTGGPGTYAVDGENYQNTGLTTNVMGRVDPIFEMNDTVRLLTRGQVAYGLTLQNMTDAGTISVNYTEADTTSSVFSYTESWVQPMSQTTHAINLELGGSAEFTAGDSLSVSTGLFYAPAFQFGSLSYEDEVTTISASWDDNSGAPDAEATGNDTIGPDAFQGSRSETTTVSRSEDGKDNETVHTFYIPVSASLDLIEDRLTLTGGYILDHTKTITYDLIPASTTSSTITVNNSGGTEVFAQTPADDVTSTTTTEEYTNKSSAGWSGLANWMLRWMATENITVDLYGQTIMTALNFSLFGNNAGQAGLNANTIVTSLGMSVGFRF